MRQKIYERAGASDELWVVWPDRPPPNGPDVVWLVYGHPDAPIGTTTIPLRRESLGRLAGVLLGLSVNGGKVKL